MVIGDCDTGTCAHLSDNKFVGCAHCEKGFDRLSVDLSKEEKLLLPLEESTFICIPCGDGYMSLKETRCYDTPSFLHRTRGGERVELGGEEKV